MVHVLYMSDKFSGSVSFSQVVALFVHQDQIQEQGSGISPFLPEVRKGARKCGICAQCTEAQGAHSKGECNNSLFSIRNQHPTEGAGCSGRSKSHSSECAPIIKHTFQFPPSWHHYFLSIVSPPYMLMIFRENHMLLNRSHSLKSMSISEMWILRLKP